MTDYKELDDESKLFFLEWVKQGLLFQNHRSVVQGTLAEFHQALRGRDFDIARIWDSQNPRTLAHLDHIAPYLVQVQDEIAVVKERLMPKEKPLPADLQPFTPAPPPPPRPRSKTRGKRQTKGCSR